MHQILFWGSIFVIALMVFSPLMPSDWLGYVIPFAYPLAAWSLAASHQMTKQAIADSQAYEFQSAWNVIAVSMVFLVAMVIVAFSWFFVLVAAGLDLIWMVLVRYPIIKSAGVRFKRCTLQSYKVFISTQLCSLFVLRKHPLRGCRWFSRLIR